MFNAIQNIAGIQHIEAVKTSEITVSGKLPQMSQNSIVEVSVLGKSQNFYRLLIEGNVFQAKLPFELNDGESFLAKVINTNPFTLSLGNLLTNLTDAKVAQLLSKLHVTTTQLSGKILKAFINSKKPVIKSRFEKLLDIIEKENLKLTDQQLQFLLNVLDTYDRGFEHLNKSFISSFQYSLNDLTSEILSCVTDLFESALPDDLKKRIKETLILRVSEGNLPDAVLLKDKTRAQIELMVVLEDFINANQISEALKNKIGRFINSVTRYSLFKANNHKIGIYPDFFIMETGNDLEVVEYQLDRSSKTGISDNFGFDLKMAPDMLGEVFIKGYLSGSNLKIDFLSSESSKSWLEDSKEKLTEDLTKKIKINPRIDFLARESSGFVNRREGLPNINVSV